MFEIFQKFNLLEKVGAAIIFSIISGLVGGRVFYTLIRYFIIKYFESIENKMTAAFKRIDEERKEHRDFKYIEFRDFKRDTVLKIDKVGESVEELYDRTDNHEQVKACIDYCDKKNKVGSSGK